MMIEKEFSSSSLCLGKSVAKAQTLKSAEIRCYRLNHASRERGYFLMTAEGKIYEPEFGYSESQNGGEIGRSTTWNLSP